MSFFIVFVIVSIIEYLIETQTITSWYFAWILSVQIIKDKYKKIRIQFFLHRQANYYK